MNSEFLSYYPCLIRERQSVADGILPIIRESNQPLFTGTGKLEDIPSVWAIVALITRLDTLRQIDYPSYTDLGGNARIKLPTLLAIRHKAISLKCQNEDSNTPG